MLVSSGIGVKLWNLDTLTLLNEYQILGKTKQSAFINSFSLKADSTQLANVVDKDSISLINFETNSQNFLTEASEVRCCSFDFAGRYLAAGKSNAMIDIFDLKSMTSKRKSFRLNSTGSINTVAFSKSDRYIATGSSNGSIVLHNMLTSQPTKPWTYSTKSFTTVNNGVTSLQPSIINGSSLGAGYEDGSVVLWDCNKGYPSCVFKGHSLMCTSVVLSPINGILMISGGLDSLFNLYDTRDTKLINSVNCTGGVSSLDMLKNGFTVCVGTVNGYIHLYDMRNMDGPYFSTKAHESSVSCVKFIQNPDSLNASSNSKERVRPQNLNVNDLSIFPTSEHSTMMKRSNSYNIETPTVPTTSYTIFSPELSHHQTNNENTLTANQISFGGESFILHKKQSTIGNSMNGTKADSTPILSGNYNGSITANEFKTANIRSNVLKGRPDVFSPYLSSSSASSGSSLVFKSDLGGILTSTAQTTNPEIVITDNTQPLIESNKSPGSLIKGPLASTISEERSPKNQINNLRVVQPALTPVSTTVNLRQKISETNGVHVEAMQMSPDDKGKGHANDVKEIVREIVKEEMCSLEEKIAAGLAEKISSRVAEKIYDKLDDYYDNLMSHNFKFKVEIYKEFSNLNENLSKQIQEASINPTLLDEIARLKEEVKKLKALY